MSEDQSFINRIFRKLYVAYENLIPVVDEIAKNASFNVNSELKNLCFNNSTLCFITQEQYVKAVNASMLIEEVNKEFNGGDKFCNDLQEDKRLQYLKYNFMRTHTENDCVNTCIKLIYVKKELIDQYITIYKLLCMVLQQLHHIVQQKNVYVKSNHNKAKSILKLKSNSKQLLRSVNLNNLSRTQKEYQRLDNAVYILKDIIKNSSTGSTDCLKESQIASKKIKLTNFLEKPEKEVKVTSIVGSKQRILECLLELAIVKQYMKNIKGRKKLTAFKNYERSNCKTQGWYTEQLKNNLNIIPSYQKPSKKTIPETLLPVEVCTNNTVTTKVMKTGIKETQEYSYLYNQQTAAFVNSVTQLLKTISSSDTRKIKIYICSKATENQNHVSENKLLIENMGPCSIINETENQNLNIGSTRFHLPYRNTKSNKQLNLSTSNFVNSYGGRRTPKLKIFTLSHDSSGIMPKVANKVFTHKCFPRKTSSQITIKNLNIEKLKKINVLTQKSLDLPHTTNNVFQKANFNKTLIYLNLKRSMSLPEQNTYRDSISNFNECFLTKRINQKDSFATGIVKTQLYSNILEQKTELNIIKNSAKMNIDCICDKKLPMNSESVTITKSIKLSESAEADGSDKLTNEIIKLDLAIDVKSKYYLQNKDNEVTYEKDEKNRSSSFFNLPYKFKSFKNVPFSNISDIVSQLWSSNSYHLKNYTNWYMQKSIQIGRKSMRDDQIATNSLNIKDLKLLSSLYSNTDNIFNNTGTNAVQQNDKLNSTSRNKSYYSRLDYYVDLLQKNFKQNIKEIYEVRYFEVQNTSKRKLKNSNIATNTNWPTLLPGIKTTQDNIYMAKSKYYNYPDDTDDRRLSRKSVERRDVTGTSISRIPPPGRHGGNNTLANQPWAPFVTSDISLPRVRYVDDDQTSQRSTVSGNKKGDPSEYEQSSQTTPKSSKGTDAARLDSASIKSGKSGKSGKSVGSNVTNLSFGKEVPQGGSRKGGPESSYGYNPTSNFGGPGNNFGGPGGNFGGPGNNFGGPGNNFGGPGNNFGSAGSNFGGPGNNFGGPGNNFGGAGSNFGGPGGNFGGPGSNFGGPGSNFDRDGFPKGSGRGGYGSSFGRDPFQRDFDKGGPGGGFGRNAHQSGFPRDVSYGGSGRDAFDGFPRKLHQREQGRTVATDVDGLPGLKKYPGYSKGMGTGISGHNIPQCGACSGKITSQSVGINTMKQSSTYKDSYVQPQLSILEQRSQYSQISRQCSCDNKKQDTFTQCQKEIPKRLRHANVQANKVQYKLCNDATTQVEQSKCISDHSRCSNQSKMKGSAISSYGNQWSSHQQFHQQQQRQQQWLHQNVCKNLNCQRYQQIDGFTRAQGNWNTSNSQVTNSKPTKDQQGKGDINTNFLKVDEKSQSIQCCLVTTDENVFLYRKNKISDSSHSTLHEANSQPSHELYLNKIKEQTSNTKSSELVKNKLGAIDVGTQYDLLNIGAKNEKNSKTSKSFTKHKNIRDYCGLLLNPDIDCSVSDHENMKQKSKLLQNNCCKTGLKNKNKEQLPVKFNKSQIIPYNYLFGLEDTDNLLEFNESQNYDIKLRKALETTCLKKLLNKNNLAKDATNNTKTAALSWQKSINSFCLPVEVKYQTQATNACMWSENSKEKLNSNYDNDSHGNTYFVYGALVNDKSNKNQFHNKTIKSPFHSKNIKGLCKSHVGDSLLSMGDIKKGKDTPSRTESSKYTVIVSDLTDATTSTLDFKLKTQNCNNVGNIDKLNKTVCTKNAKKKDAKPKNIQSKNKINCFKNPIKKFVSFTGSTISITENNDINAKQNYITKQQRFFHEQDVSSNIDCIIHEACKVISQMSPQKSRIVNTSKQSPYKKYISLEQSPQVYRMGTFWIPPDYEDSEFNFDIITKENTPLINKTY